MITARPYCEGRRPLGRCTVVATYRVGEASVCPAHLSRAIQDLLTVQGEVTVRHLQAVVA